VRYKRSLLGFIWSFVNPLFFILTYVVIFKYIMQSSEPNYSANLFCTLLAWRFFSTAVLDAAASIGAKLSLIKLIKFPRIILPAAALGANFFDYLFSLVVLAIFFFAMRITLNWPYLALAVAALAFQIIFMFGLSLLLASLNVFYSDVQFLVANLFQMWFFLTPIIYAPDKVISTPRFPLGLKIAYFLDPVSIWMIAYRSVLPGQEPNTVFKALNQDYYVFFGISALVAILIFLFGVVVFKRLEPKFTKEI
jgi:ABC-type polysaccharide/polyol phosphate export permease